MLDLDFSLEFTYFQNTFWLVLMSEAILSSYDLRRDLVKLCRSFLALLYNEYSQPLYQITYTVAKA